jgi:hypothetical protein
MNRQWTPEAIRALGATTNLPTLGSILGVSRWKAYKMTQTGEWEQVGIRIVPVGAQYRVVVQSILDVLGYDDARDTGNGHDPSTPGPTAAEERPTRRPGNPQVPNGVPPGTVARPHSHADSRATPLRLPRQR